MGKERLQILKESPFLTMLGAINFSGTTWFPDQDKYHDTGPICITMLLQEHARLLVGMSCVHLATHVHDDAAPFLYHTLLQNYLGTVDGGG